MAKKNTVLILGAGASKDYGYPLGYELKDRIIEALNQIIYREPNLDSTIILPTQIIDDPNNSVNRLRYLVNNLGISLDLIKAFKNDFENAYKNSIDAFLDTRREFLKLGKAMIAMTLFEYENESQARNQWYSHILSDIADTWETLDDLNLSIITYNYDRSLEYHFINGLKATHGKTIEECLDKLSKIKIVHVHGMLADIPYSPYSKPYNKNFTASDLDKAIENLNIIFEEEEVQESYKEIRGILSHASQVFILGFGYENRNLKRLQLERVRVDIFSTRYGMTDLEANDIRVNTDYKISFCLYTDRLIIPFFKENVKLSGVNNYHHFLH